MLTSPKQFAPREGSFAEIRKRYIALNLVLVVLACSAGFVISMVNARKAGKDDVNVLPIVLPVFALAISFGLWKGMKRQKAAFESYRLTIEPNSLYRDMDGVQTIQMYHSEVARITKNKHGAVTIYGAEKESIIRVPAQIDNRDQLEELLSMIRPIESTDGQSLQPLKAVLMSVATLGLMTLTFISRNAIVVTIAGLALTAFLTWSFIVTRRNPEIDDKTKKGMTMVFLLVFSILMKVILVWTQP
ncbi:MAG: hypothetical protein JWP27_2607 [Flaviaesturariibacter sp.]|nr:hypothetical protein [Flaviaesturariibacter sp.]